MTVEAEAPLPSRLFRQIGIFGLRIITLILVLTALAWSHPAAAHESRPAYLQIREIAPERYDILWRTPVLAGMPLPVGLVLPDSVRNVVEPAIQRLNDSLLERRRVGMNTGSLSGARIGFEGLEATITDVLVETEWLDGSKTTTIVRPSQPWLLILTRQTVWDVARAYTTLGVEHILTGVDHLLFVLALILVTHGSWQLLKTVTAFTVAHSISLGLAVLGYVHVPPRPVEAVIALSIVFVAAEIVHARRGVIGITMREPWIVAFLFGLLHGLGFAGALSEIGLPQGHIPSALLFFNLGVEIGQLVFVSLVLAIFAVIRKLRYDPPVWANLIPPYLIGGTAMFWVLQRVIAI